MIRLSVTIPAAHLELDNRLVRATLRAGGAEVAKEARRLIRNAPGGGKIYRGPGGSARSYRGGYTPGSYTASAPGEAPKSVTGTLLRNIVVRPFKSGEGVAISETPFYARFLEVGASGGSRFGSRSSKRRGKDGISQVRIMQPRPSLTTALQDKGPALGPRLVRAVTEGISLKLTR